MMPRSKRRRAKRFWHQLRPVCGEAYQQMWMNGGGEGGKIELSLLILPLAYQEENVPSTIAPRQVPLCECLVLQRFQYLISAEWDRGFVRACFHWNKTNKKKVWILAILWIGHYSQLCRCQETNFILDHGKGLFIPSYAFYFQNSFNQAKKKKPKVALFCTLTKVRLILRGSHLFFLFVF